MYLMREDVRFAAGVWLVMLGLGAVCLCTIPAVAGGATTMAAGLLICWNNSA